MHYEAKHFIFKQMASKYRNYKNLAKTLATWLRCQDHLFLENSCLLYIHTTGLSLNVLFENYLYQNLLIQNEKNLMLI